MISLKATLTIQFITIGIFTTAGLILTHYSHLRYEYLSKQ